VLLQAFLDQNGCNRIFVYVEAQALI